MDFQQILRWSLLAAAVVFMTGGVMVLVNTALESDEQFAGFALLMMSAVCLGAFLRDRNTGREDD